MWVFGFVWLSLSVAIFSISRNKSPCKMGCWGFIFEAGAFMTSTLTMDEELPPVFFGILGIVSANTVFHNLLTL
jgi:tellurite resistance protein TehA-like permease